MMKPKIAARCPFRDGSNSRAIYLALAKSSKPLSMVEISKRAKVSFQKTETLVRAYMNPFHNATMRRIGIAIVHDKKGFKLAICKPQPKAKRPERGRKGKKARPKRAVKRSARRRKPAVMPPPPPVAAPPETLAPTAAPSS
jgi:hypothetical protein